MVHGPNAYLGQQGEIKGPVASKYMNSSPQFFPATVKLQQSGVFHIIMPCRNGRYRGLVSMETVNGCCINGHCTGSEVISHQICAEVAGVGKEKRQIIWLGVLWSCGLEMGSREGIGIHPTCISTLKQSLTPLTEPSVDTAKRKDAGLTGSCLGSIRLVKGLERWCNLDLAQ